MLVVDENVSAADLQQLDDAGDWLRLMARSTFRRTETGIVVNIMLPDRIFEREENSKRLVKFSYAKKWNMLVASRDFTNLVIFPVLMTFTALAKVAQPTYKWMRPKKGEAG
jgi:hypothetical protein